MNHVPTIPHTLNSQLKKSLAFCLYSFFWAFRRSRRAFRYIFARHVSVSLLKIEPRHFDRLSDLVPVPESRSQIARKGCRSNP